MLYIKLFILAIENQKQINEYFLATIVDGVPITMISFHNMQIQILNNKHGLSYQIKKYMQIKDKKMYIRKVKSTKNIETV